MKKPLLSGSSSALSDVSPIHGSSVPPTSGLDPDAEESAEVDGVSDSGSEESATADNDTGSVAASDASEEELTAALQALEDSPPSTEITITIPVIEEDGVTVGEKTFSLKSNTDLEWGALDVVQKKLERQLRQPGVRVREMLVGLLEVHKILSISFGTKHTMIDLRLANGADHLSAWLTTTLPAAASMSGAQDTIAAGSKKLPQRTESLLLPRAAKAVSPAPPKTSAPIPMSEKEAKEILRAAYRDNKALPALLDQLGTNLDANREPGDEVQKLGTIFQANPSLRDALLRLEEEETDSPVRNWLQKFKLADKAAQSGATPVSFATPAAPTTTRGTDQKKMSPKGALATAATHTTSAAGSQAQPSEEIIETAIRGNPELGEVFHVLMQTSANGTPDVKLLARLEELLRKQPPQVRNVLVEMGVLLLQAPEGVKSKQAERKSVGDLDLAGLPTQSDRRAMPAQTLMLGLMRELQEAQGKGKPLSQGELQRLLLQKLAKEAGKKLLVPIVVLLMLCAIVLYYLMRWFFSGSSSSMSTDVCFSADACPPGYASTGGSYAGRPGLPGCEELPDGDYSYHP